MALAAILPLTCGCLRVQLPARPALPLLHHSGMEQASQFSGLLPWFLAVGAALVVSWGIIWWLCSRPGPSDLDRQDLALLRTARDALALLRKKRRTRLRMVWDRSRRAD